MHSPVRAELVALWALDLGGALTFLIVAANVPTKRIKRWLVVAMGAPVLLQAALYVLHVPGTALAYVTVSLFLLPSLQVSLDKQQRKPAIDSAGLRILCCLP